MCGAFVQKKANKITLDPRLELKKRGNAAFYDKILKTDIDNLMNFIGNERLRPWAVFCLITDGHVEKAEHLARWAQGKNPEEAGQTYELALMNLLAQGKQAEREVNKTASRRNGEANLASLKASLELISYAMETILNNLDGMNTRGKYTIKTKWIRGEAARLWD